MASGFYNRYNVLMKHAFISFGIFKKITFQYVLLSGHPRGSNYMKSNENIII